MRGSDNTAVSYGLQAKAPSQSVPRVASYGEHESFMAGPDSPPDDDDDQYQEHAQRIPLHDRRTVLITNLSERTTHKDLASIVRGGRLLDIFIRNDRSATVSFMEGAAEFLAYAKRNDIYLHMKRVSHACPTIVCTANHVSSSFAGTTDSSTFHRTCLTRSLTELHETLSCEVLQARSPQTRSETILTISTTWSLWTSISRKAMHTYRPIPFITLCLRGPA